MHNLKGLEKLNSKFYTMQETVVDIEVKTSDAEDAMEEAQVVSSEIDEDLDVVEGASDEIETLRLYQEHLKKYPLTKANYSLINLNNSLSKYSNQLVAVESFNDNVTNDMVIAGIEGIIDNVTDKIKNMLKGVSDKFKNLVDKFSLMFGNWKRTLEATQRLIQSIPDTSSTEIDSKTVEGIQFEQCDQIVSTLTVLNSKLNNLGDILYIADKKIMVKPINKIIDKEILTKLRFGNKKAIEQTPIDISKISKNELSKMCTKLISACDIMNRINEMLFVIMSELPTIKRLSNQIQQIDLTVVGILKYIDEKDFRQAAQDIVELSRSATETVVDCNNSFIRIVKARAKA